MFCSRMNEQFELNGKLIRAYLKREARKHSWLVGQLGISQSLVDKMLGGYVPREETLDAVVALTGIKKEELLIPREKTSA